MAEQSTSQMADSLQDPPVIVPARMTPHRPPPSSTSSTSRPTDENPNRRTIKINIEIDIPKDLLPNFGRKSKFFHFSVGKLLVVALYVGFFVCAAVALGLHKEYDIGIALPVLIIALFVPILDFIGNVWAVLLMKSDQENDPKKPSFKHAFVLLINFLLLALNFVIMIFACVWTQTRYHSWYGYYSGVKTAIVGLTLSNSVSMIFIKLVLAYVVFVHPDCFKGNGISIRRRWNRGYEELGGDIDEDARVAPGTFVNHSDDDTPRNSAEDGRIVLL